MTLGERCDDANTEIIVVKEGCRESRRGEEMGEPDRSRRREGREEMMAELVKEIEELSCREGRRKRHMERGRGKR